MFTEEIFFGSYPYDFLKTYIDNYFYMLIIVLIYNIYILNIHNLEHECYIYIENI